MPPITSSRPGARDTRTIVAAGPAPNVGNSFLIRRSSVGTGSRLCRLSGAGTDAGSGGWPGGGLADGDGVGGCNFLLLTFKSVLVHETSPALVKPRLQHVTALGANRWISELKAI